MSVLKPEVGDVFLNKHSRRKTIILCDRNYYQCLVENGGLVARYKDLPTEIVLTKIEEALK